MDSRTISKGDLVVRQVANGSDLGQIEKIQNEAWGLTGGDVVREAALEAVARHGIVLGAYTTDPKMAAAEGGDMVGYVLGFDGHDEGLYEDIVRDGILVPGHLMAPIEEYRLNGRDVHYMHMIAVRGNLKSNGIGERLQAALGEEVLKRGIPLVEWTYDPLLSINANLFIRKMGGRVESPEQYIVDCYGSNVSGMYMSIPSDRFLARWRPKDGLKGMHKRYETLRGEGATLVCDTEPMTAMDGAGNREVFRRLESIDLSRLDEQLLMEIPSNYNSGIVIEHDGAQANKERMKWRLESRAALQNYLGKGYSVDDVVLRPCDPADGGLRTYYVLARGDKS